MNTPEAITSALWAERDQYPQLQNDEFESEAVLLKTREARDASNS